MGSNQNSYNTSNNGSYNNPQGSLRYQRDYNSSAQAPREPQGYGQNSYRPRGLRFQQRGGGRGSRNYSNSRNQNYYQNDRYYQGPRKDDRYQTPEFQPEPENIKRPEIPNEPPEKLLEKYEARLKLLENAVGLEDITGIDSKWGVKPKGFENVTSQRAKLSGLFPLPGYPRPVDFTKLEGIVKNRTSDGNDILLDTSKIDLNDSRVAKLIILQGIDFDTVDYLKVSEYINKQLSRLEVPGISEQNIQSKTKTKDNKILVIEFENNTCATICLALNGTKATIENTDIVFNFQRPKGYIAQGFINDDNNADNALLREVVEDNAYKVTISVGEEYEEDDIVRTIEEVSPIVSFQLLKEKLSKQSIGIAFANFKLDNYNPLVAVPRVQQISDALIAKDPDMIKQIRFSCIIPNETSIQECPSDLHSLLKFVRNESISSTKKLRVIQLINAVTANDLIEDEKYAFIYEDIEQEAKTFGDIIRIRIPRPANEYTPGLTQFSEPGLGKIFIEFADELAAFKAIMGMAGRLYNDRTVLCSYYDADDFNIGIL